MTVLFDANVLLDVLAERQPFHVAAASAWSLAESKQIDAFVSAMSFSNIYYIVRHSLGRERALAAVRAIARGFSRRTCRRANRGAGH